MSVRKMYDGNATRVGADDRFSKWTIENENKMDTDEVERLLSPRDTTPPPPTQPPIPNAHVMPDGSTVPNCSGWYGPSKRYDFERLARLGKAVKEAERADKGQDKDGSGGVFEDIADKKFLSAANKVRRAADESAESAPARKRYRMGRHAADPYRAVKSRMNRVFFSKAYSKIKDEK